MDTSLYLGAIYYNEQWFLRADATRYAWALDLSKALPRQRVESRKNSIVATNNIQAYLDSFDLHLEHIEAKNTIDLQDLSFVVDFEKKIFIDRDADEALFLPIEQYMDNQWKYRVNSPYFYIPESIVELWLKKRITTDHQFEIPRIVSIGGVKYRGIWKFYFHLEYMWWLDMSWKLESEYGSWRQDLPVITNDNVKQYLNKLQPYELSIEQLSHTTYHMTEDDKLDVEEMMGYAKDEETLEILQQKLYEINKLNSLRLSVIIDFDNHRYILTHPYRTRPQEKVEPRIVHAPDDWDCYWGKPVEALPEHLKQFWK